MKQMGRRGLLIVFEGCDRSGKTTHCQRLVRALNEKANGKVDEKANGKADEKANGTTDDKANGDADPAAHFMRFPDRSTLGGGVIDRYLKGQQQLDDHAIHLLFSMNRWEKVAEMRSALAAGRHVIVDRYAFSGAAFSAAKDGLSLEWCRQPDRGLPRPDLVCFLDVSPSEARQRGGFGEERYEKEEFQARVRKNYDALMDETWRVIDTDGRSLDGVYEAVEKLVTETVEKASQGPDRPLAPLWPMGGDGGAENGAWPIFRSLWRGGKCGA